MPRDGGSSQNGPIEGHDIVHGNSGDVSIYFDTTLCLVFT